MFRKDRETDLKIRHRVFELWLKSYTRQLGSESERIYHGLNLSNPHGYETRNELDD